jgi:hypothetical protein
MEVALASYFDSRRNLIVPNVSWGLGIHECDLLIVTRSGYATEVEIKCSRYDLKRDCLKHHGHRSKLIKRLYFAIPEQLLGFLSFIPEQAGVIVLTGDADYCSQPRCREVRKPAINNVASRLRPDQIEHLGRLAAMRIWDLKKSLAFRQAEEPVVI